ncbi:MAG: hypothetical protein AAFR61_26920 [Bacteroidota bacterium]
MRPISSIPFLLVLLWFGTGATALFAQKSKPPISTGNGKDPLVLVDHIPLKNKAEMELVKPEQIESVEVNKKNPERLYGPKAKHGAVLVITKLGNFEEIRRAYYWGLIQEQVTEAEKNPDYLGRKIQFVVDGELQVSLGRMKNLSEEDIQDLRMLSAREGRVEFGKKAKGLWYVISTQ